MILNQPKFSTLGETNELFWRWQSAPGPGGPAPEKYPASAEVVELVDTLVSGTSGSNPMGVRVPPSAPVIYKKRNPMGFRFFSFCTIYTSSRSSYFQT